MILVNQWDWSKEKMVSIESIEQSLFNRQNGPIEEIWNWWINAFRWITVFLPV